MAIRPAFPQPAAPLPGETDILASVVADLSDDTAKLVYADWLEERDDPRGAFLRRFVESKLSGSPLPDAATIEKPWLDLIGFTLTAGIQAHGFQDRAETFLRLARPAVTIQATRTTDEDLSVGASKFGGLPDLSPSVDWPSWQRGTLAFLGQLNLAELSVSQAGRCLPNTGLLSIFYDTEGEVWGTTDNGGWRVLFTSDTSRLMRRQPPTELIARNQFNACRLLLAEIVTLPHPDSPWSDELALNDRGQAYHELIENPGLGHRILGYPHPLQCDVLGRQDIRHLFTIDSDDAPGWMWGDCGLLYFLIEEVDLQAAKFDRVHFEMQCC